METASCLLGRRGPWGLVLVGIINNSHDFIFFPKSSRLLSVIYCPMQNIAALNWDLMSEKIKYKRDFLKKETEKPEEV